MNISATRKVGGSTSASRTERNYAAGHPNSQFVENIDTRNNVLVRDDTDGHSNKNSYNAQKEETEKNTEISPSVAYVKNSIEALAVSGVFDEKEDHIGGQINIAAVPPRKSEILRSIEYYEKILPGLGVKIHLNSECSKDVMNKADALVVAIGAHDVNLKVAGSDGAKVVSSWDVLANKATPKGHCIVIGGGLVGTETAEYLLSKGNQVTIIEMLDKIANGESSTVMPLVMEDFNKGGVKQYVNTQVERIEDDGKRVVAKDMKTKKTIVIEGDATIMAVGSKKNELDLEGVSVPTYYVGDCAMDKTADIASAIRTAYKAANSI